jgi:hypothetical protein
MPFSEVDQRTALYKGHQFNGAADLPRQPLQTILFASEFNNAIEMFALHTLTLAYIRLLPRKARIKAAKPIIDVDCFNS